MVLHGLLSSGKAASNQEVRRGGVRCQRFNHVYQLKGRKEKEAKQMERQMSQKEQGPGGRWG